MFHLIWLQFKHSWKTWMSTFIVFLVAGFLTGICLIGLFSLAQGNNAGQINTSEALPIFLMPTIFGGITVFFVIGGVIRLIINQFREEYILWAVLGSNPNQLSLLVGGQLAMIGAIGGVFGYVCALPFTPFLYYWMQQIVGEKMLPSIQIVFSLPAFFLTILFVFLLGGIGGIQHSRKLFLHAQKDIVSFKKQVSEKISWYKKMMIVICLLVMFSCYFIIFKGLTATEQLATGVIEMQLCFVLMFFLILLFNLIAPHILPIIIKVWTWVLPRKKLAALNTAFWSVITRRDYLASVIVPIMTASLLLSGFSSIISNIFNQSRSMGAQEQATENLLVIILYLGAPLMIILTNVIAISMISSKQQIVHVKQLFLLGFTPRKIIEEKLFEILIYSLTFFFSSIICNFLVSLAVSKVAITINQYATISWESVIFWPVVLLIAMIVVMSCINLFQLYKNNGITIINE